MSDLVTRAFVFALQAHTGQTRKNHQRDPYISHPFEVMVLLAESDVKDKNVLAAALLHDVVEDTSVTHADIEKAFGNKVSDFVKEVSDDKSLNKYERKKAQLVRIAKASPGAQMIKMADKWSNCRTLKTDPPKGWTRDDVIGYAAWSFRLCANAAFNTQISAKLKKTVYAMFEKDFGFSVYNTQSYVPHIETYFTKLKAFAVPLLVNTLDP